MEDSKFIEKELVLPEKLDPRLCYLFSDMSDYGYESNRFRFWTAFYTLIYWMFAVSVCITALLFCIPLFGFPRELMCDATRRNDIIAAVSIILIIGTSNIILGLIPSSYSRRITISWMMILYETVALIVCIIMIIITEISKHNPFTDGVVIIFVLVTLLFHVIQEFLTLTLINRMLIKN